MAHSRPVASVVWIDASEQIIGNACGPGYGSKDNRQSK
jgi:hypothetical protein